MDAFITKRKKKEEKETKQAILKMENLNRHLFKDIK